MLMTSQDHLFPLLWQIVGGGGWQGLAPGTGWWLQLAAFATPSLTPSCGAVLKQKKAATWSHPSTLLRIIRTRLSGVSKALEQPECGHMPFLIATVLNIWLSSVLSWNIKLYRNRKIHLLLVWTLPKICKIPKKASNKSFSASNFGKKVREGICLSPPPPNLS